MNNQPQYQPPPPPPPGRGMAIASMVLGIISLVIPFVGLATRSCRACFRRDCIQKVEKCWGSDWYGNSGNRMLHHYLGDFRPYYFPVLCSFILCRRGGAVFVKDS